MRRLNAFLVITFVLAALVLPSLTAFAMSSAMFSFDLFRWYIAPALSIPTTGDVAADVATAVAIGSILLTMARSVMADVKGGNKSVEEVPTDDTADLELTAEER